MSVWIVSYLVIGFRDDSGAYEWAEISSDATSREEAMQDARAREARGYVVKVEHNGAVVFHSPLPEGVQP